MSTRKHSLTRILNAIVPCGGLVGLEFRRLSSKTQTPDGKSEIYIYGENAQRFLSIGSEHVRLWFGGSEIRYSAQTGAQIKTITRISHGGRNVARVDNGEDLELLSSR